MSWGLLVTVSAVHVVIMLGCCVVVGFSTPKIPSRVSFFEMQARAVRMRDVVLPAMAAAILGFFVSLAASYVHAGFSAPVVTMLELPGSTYVYILFVGAVSSLIALLALMDKMRSDAKSMARHPASINRAAEILLRGKDVEGLDAHDFRGSLDQWQARAGREAMRIILRRKDSPHVNALLQEVRKGVRRPRRPRQMSSRLLLEAFKDQPLRGMFVFLGFGTPFVASLVAFFVALAANGQDATEGSRLFLPLVCAVLQITLGLFFLRLNATFVIRCWRIDEIELRAAKRRIARLVAANATVREAGRRR